MYTFFADYHYICENMKRSLSAFFCGVFLAVACAGPAKEKGWWQMRGIVLSTKELAEVDWPALAARSGINTIGTHITPSEVLAFLDSHEARSDVAGGEKGHQKAHGRDAQYRPENV